MTWCHHPGDLAMRLIAFPLLALLVLAVASSASAAPAPLPRRDSEPAAQKRERALAEYRRKLDEMGVKWQVVDHQGRPIVRFNVQHPNGRSGMGGGFPVNNGALVGTLQNVIRRVEAFLRNDKRW
jgi:hypothetical protein